MIDFIKIIEIDLASVLNCTPEIAIYLESLNKNDFEDLTLDELSRLNALCQKYNVDISTLI